MGVLWDNRANTSVSKTCESGRRSAHSKRKCKVRVWHSLSSLAPLPRAACCCHAAATAQRRTPPQDHEQTGNTTGDLDLFLRSGIAGRLRTVSPESQQQPALAVFAQLRNVEDTSRMMPMSPAWSRISGDVPKNSSEKTPSMPPAPRQPAPPAAHGLAAANALAPP